MCLIFICLLVIVCEYKHISCLPHAKHAVSWRCMFDIQCKGCAERAVYALASSDLKFSPIVGCCHICTRTARWFCYIWSSDIKRARPTSRNTNGQLIVALELAKSCHPWVNELCCRSSLPLVCAVECGLCSAHVNSDKYMANTRLQVLLAIFTVHNRGGRRNPARKYLKTLRCALLVLSHLVKNVWELLGLD